MNQAEKAVKKASRGLDKIFDVIYKDIDKIDLLNTAPNDVKKKIKAVVSGYEQEIRDVVLSGIDTAIGVSPLSKIVRDQYKVGGLSKLYDKDNLIDLISSSVEKSISTYQNYNQATRELRGIMTKSVDHVKAVKRLQASAKDAFRIATTDAEKTRALSTINKTKRLLEKENISKISLRTLGQEVSTGLPKDLSKSLDKAIRDKAKSDAMRVVRTEYAGAYGDTVLSEAYNDDRVVAVQFTLNSSHDIFDICNFHTEANLYGLGEGVYPKDKQPEYPFHPNCMCKIDQVYIGEVDPSKEKNFDRKEGKKYLDSLSTTRREELLGVNGNELYENGTKWEKTLLNYNGQKQFTPVK
jgi:hypothetical protein